jgi:hypothetical protein
VRRDTGSRHNRFDRSTIEARLMGTSGIFDENLLFGTIFGPPVDVLRDNRFDPGPPEALRDARRTYGRNSTVVRVGGEHPGCQSAPHITELCTLHFDLDPASACHSSCTSHHRIRTGGRVSVQRSTAPFGNMLTHELLCLNCTMASLFSSLVYTSGTIKVGGAKELEDKHQTALCVDRQGRAERRQVPSEDVSRH